MPFIILIHSNLLIVEDLVPFLLLKKTYPYLDPINYLSNNYNNSNNIYLNPNPSVIIRIFNNNQLFFKISEAH